MTTLSGPEIAVEATARPSSLTRAAHRVSPIAATRAASYCGELIAQSRIPPGAMAAVFRFEPPSGVRLVAAVSSPQSTTSPELLGAAALAVIEAGHALRLGPLPGPGVALGGAQLGLPAWFGGELLAVVVLLAAPSELDPWASRLDPFLTSCAMAAEGERVQAALERRGEDLSAMRQQLDAYATDFRSSYMAEQARSEQLASALAELEQTYTATVHGMALAVEAKDECTGGHLRRVCRYGMMLTALVAPEHAADPQFEYGFLLHDIGKLTVPDYVLLKPGPLDEAEWAVMRQHPEAGRSILAEIPFLVGAREIVHAHHERWDGRGYPRGLIGEEIPLGAQIFPICDAFDAMTSDRPYREALSCEDAREEIRRGSASQFRPDAVEAFLSLPLGELEAVQSAPVIESLS